MFTLTDIREAHSRVKTGADFPAYAREISALGVTTYDTYVSDGHAVYLGGDEPVISPGKYDTLEISEISHRDSFIERLRLHQSGETDYMTFCRDCAESGVEKWTIDLRVGSCTYFGHDKAIMFVEYFT